MNELLQALTQFEPEFSMKNYNQLVSLTDKIIEKTYAPLVCCIIIV